MPAISVRPDGPAHTCPAQVGPAPNRGCCQPEDDICSSGERGKKGAGQRTNAANSTELGTGNRISSRRWKKFAQEKTQVVRERCVSQGPESRQRTLRLESAR